MERPWRRTEPGHGAVCGLVLAIALAAVAEAAGSPQTDDARGAARAILEATGIQGGLVVHLFCGDGRLTAALRANDSYLVQGLDTDPADLEKAVRHIRALGLEEEVSVDSFDGVHLPYVDGLANLVVAEDLGSVGRDEVLRVLAPGGVAWVKEEGSWKKTVKPWPEDIDEWTHYLHDASGNAVAADLQVGPPTNIRWISHPVWSRSHEFNPSINALAVGGGRIFHTLDEGIQGLPDLRFPARWSLYARDAFSGVLLWKRPIPNWGYREWNTRGMWSAPLTLPRRLVTDGRRVFFTFGYKAPMTVLDAPTGKTIQTLPGTEGTDEAVLIDGVLLLCVRQQLSVASPPKTPPKRRQNPGEWNIGSPGPASIVAIDVASSRVLWKLPPQQVTILTLAARDGRVCFHGADGVTCLDLEDGQRLWATASPPLRESRHSGGTLVVHKEVVLFTSAKGLKAYSVKDGQELWTSPPVRGPGVTHPPDLFVAGGLVWGGDTPGSHSRERTLVRREGRDPVTGEVKRTVEVQNLISPLHHFRCYRSKATERYLLLTKRGVEFLDLQGEDHMRHDWLRAMCHYGFIPCNGLLYVPSHHCFCYPGVKMKGFLALASGGGSPGRQGEARVPVSRLQKGPVFSDPAGKDFSSLPEEWPTYRGDALRSGHSDTPVPSALERVWKTDLGGKVTPPVLAGGKVFVAQIDRRRICCLNEADGKLEWTFTAGARVDSPPTIHEGQVLFGCRDGWVYCLRASDGKLAWRFLVAPEDRRIVAFDGVESPWPVPGSVLMLDGIAYVACGRSSYLDQGIHLYGLEPRTGEMVCQTRVEGPWPDMQEKVGRPFDMEGTKSDILVTDGSHIFLYQMAFNKKLEKVDAPRMTSLGDRKVGRHLIATGGFLDDTWFDRTYWVYGDRWPGFYYANAAPKAGQILSFDGTTTYGLHVYTKRLRLSPSFTPGAGYELFADDNDNDPILTSRSAGREKGPGFSRGAPPRWSTLIPLRALAMVLAGDKLFLAGPPDVVPEDDPYAAFEGRRGAQLWVVSSADGAKLAEYPLDSLPVFDGLIAVGGRLYLTTQDGAVRCYAPPRYTLEVDAGDADRKETPLRWQLPEGADSSGEWRLVRMDGTEVAVQIDRTDPPAAVWMLAEPLSAGERRRYILEPKRSWRFANRVTCVDVDGKSLLFRVGGKDVLAYNYGTIQPPRGVEQVFERSGYIHPLYSPSGHLLSNDFPLNHKHHHGIWMPWSNTVFEGRPTNFWEQVRKEGRIECVGVDAGESGPVFGRVRARHRFTDLKAPSGPEAVLDETWEVTVYALSEYHIFDFVSVERCAGSSPLQLRKHRYGGFGFRGSGQWEGPEGVHFLTSEGKTRKDGHATTARWCDMHGEVEGKPVGIGFLCHPSNFRAPQGMRIHPTEPFFNFTPCQAGDFEIQPGRQFVSRYRMVLHEGAAGSEEMDRLWKDYADPPGIRRVVE